LTIIRYVQEHFSERLSLCPLQHRQQTFADMGQKGKLNLDPRAQKRKYCGVWMDVGTILGGLTPGPLNVKKNEKRKS